jgi:hypothetical protein
MPSADLAVVALGGALAAGGAAGVKAAMEEVAGVGGGRAAVEKVAVAAGGRAA